MERSQELSELFQRLTNLTLALRFVNQGAWPDEGRRLTRRILRLRADTMVALRARAGVDPSAPK